MKNNQNTGYSLSTQYTAWLMSMLLVFSSITPSWAGGSLKPRTTKGLRALTKRGINIQANPALNNSLNRAVAVAMREAPQLSRMNANVALLNVSAQIAATNVPAEFKGLRAQQALSQGTHPAVETIHTQVAEVLDLTENKLAEVEQTSVTFPYVQQAKTLLQQIKEVFKLKRDVAKKDLENLRQSARELYESMFNDPQLQPAFARANAVMPQGTRLPTPEELFGSTKELALKQYVDSGALALLGIVPGLLCTISGLAVFSGGMHSYSEEGDDHKTIRIIIGLCLIAVGISIILAFFPDKE